jgi:hypothetical protein
MRGEAMGTEVMIMIFFGAGIMVALAFSLLAIVLHEIRDERSDRSSEVRTKSRR